MSATALNLPQGIENIRNLVESAWDVRNEINSTTRGEKRSAVDQALELLDKGEIRVAQKTESGWQVNDWVKKAILLSFRFNESQVMGGGPVSGATPSMWYDKVPSKFAGWNDLKFIQAGFRAVPGCFVRKGSYIARDVVLMPSFVNIGAYVDSGTMVDTWATIGSCAQIGKNCHISGGAGIGGVLEPLQASPVIIEDDCFIGARAEIAEGVVVEKGAVISMGVYIGASTKVIDRETGEVFFGRVPENSVVVPGNMPGKPLPDGSMGPSLYCAVIVKRADEKTRSKTSINEILRSL